MASQVFFWNLRTSFKAPYEKKIKKLLSTAGFLEKIESKDLVAIKMHFGEKGTTSFISPIWVQPIVKILKKSGAKCFLTDTNTLYVGDRGEAVSHVLRATKHGFDPAIVGAPVIIADGLKSTNEIVLNYQGKHFEKYYFGKDFFETDAMVNLSHFKGHELTGFGGAIKNIGMGCASRKGKMQQHRGLGLKVKRENCVGCGRCIESCQAKALSLDDENKIVIDNEKCVGCANCLLACRNNAIYIDWKVDVKVFLERLTEYFAAFISNFKKPIIHINFIMNVSPLCDCAGFSDAPICPDIGVVASYDPVAVDKASLDMVNQAIATNVGQYKEDPTKHLDKFKAVHPHTMGEYLLEYAEKLGVGQRKYELVNI
ncbi:DUF362 domain-containing protein [Desulfothermus naphthae]